MPWRQIGAMSSATSMPNRLWQHYSSGCIDRIGIALHHLNNSKKAEKSVTGCYFAGEEFIFSRGPNFNSSPPSAAYIRQWIGSALVQIMACRQAITWANTGLLSIGILGRNFSEILIKIQNFSFTKMHLKISSAKWRPFCPGVDELSYHYCRILGCGHVTKVAIFISFYFIMFSFFIVWNLQIRRQCSVISTCINTGIN